MKLYKNKYVILACLLFLAAGLAEGIVYLYYGELQANPPMLGHFLRIYPVYNDNGSWLHGRMGIGYIRSLLIVEDIASLLVEVFLIRYISVMCHFFSLPRRGIMAVITCGVSATVYRLFTRIRGVYVLDYLYVRGRGVFDLPDLYLFLTMAGIIVWILPYLGAYRPYKKKKTQGMSLRQKWGWEFKFSGALLKAALLSRDRQEELFEKWR